MVRTGIHSMDEKLDVWMKELMEWILALLPMWLLQNGLAFFVSVLETAKAIWSQSKRTANAISMSFQKPDIHFFNYNGLYVPVVRYSNQKSILTGTPEWAYIAETDTIYNVPTALTQEQKTHSVPFLGAVLHFTRATNQWDKDITEWLANQRFSHTTDQIPLQVLVLKWAFDNDISIGNTFEGYTLTVYTLEGEEYTCDVATEEIIERDTSSEEELEEDTQEVVDADKTESQADAEERKEAQEATVDEESQVTQESADGENSKEHTD
jgi:hypothetical protein